MISNRYPPYWISVVPHYGKLKAVFGQGYYYHSVKIVKETIEENMVSLRVVLQ